LFKNLVFNWSRIMTTATASVGSWPSSPVRLKWKCGTRPGERWHSPGTPLWSHDETSAHHHCSPPKVHVTKVVAGVQAPLHYNGSCRHYRNVIGCQLEHLDIKHLTKGKMWHKFY
jgi:hypothetical protein